MKENRRLKELKLAFYINYVDKAEDKITYNRIMKLLSALVGSIGKEEHEIFTKLTMESIGENLLNASAKEVVATSKAYFSNQKAAKLLGISNQTFYNRYRHLLSRDFIDDEFLESLKPMFESEKAYTIIDLIIKFIESFKFDIGDSEIDIKDNDRTLEIEFWLIYDKIMSILQNSIICDKFLFNVCNLFEIDYNDITPLKNNIHIITRQYPHFRYNNRYFMQEIVYLYSKKGLSKCQISSKVLGKDSNFLYIGTNQAYNKLIDSDDAEWQYVPTLDWKTLDKFNVIKFIDLFHTFIKYDF